MERTCVGSPFFDKRCGDGVHRQAEKVPDLRGKNNDCDAACKTHDHGVGNEFNDGAEFEKAHGHKDDAAHDRRDQEAIHAEFLDYAVNDDHESAGRSADLNAAAAEARDEEAGNDGCHKPLVGGDAGGNGKSNREREGDNAHNNPRNAIGVELGPGIILESGE